MRYLISGYYGEKNAGDEAILAGILQEVGRRDPQAVFTVLSFDPEDTRHRHGVEVLSTSLRDPAGLAAAMRASDLLISGGGSILHEADFEVHGRSFLFREGKLRPVPYFLSVVLLARAVGLPVMWYAQGLGPLHTAAARQLVGAAGTVSQVVTWRDPDSARLAAEVGVRPPVQLVVSDPAYALEPAGSERVARELEAAGFPGGTRYLTVCPRPWLARTAYRDAIVSVVGRVAAAHDLGVVFLPFHDRLDAPLCVDLASRTPLADRAWVMGAGGDPRLLTGLLQGAVCALTMRLHSGILAAAAGTPAVAVVYDPKVAAFAAQTGQGPWSVSVDALEDAGGATRLEAALEETIALLPQRRATLARRVSGLQAEAGRTAQLAVQLAAGDRLDAFAHARPPGVRPGAGAPPTRPPSRGSA